MLFELLKDHFWMFSMEFRTIPDRWCKQSIAGVRILDGGSCTMMACSKTFVKCKHLVLNSRDSNDWVLKLYHYISNLDLSISFFQMFFLDEWDPIASLPSHIFPIWCIVFKKVAKVHVIAKFSNWCCSGWSSSIGGATLMWDRGGKCSGKKPSLHSTQLSKEPHWNLASSAPAYRRHVTYNDD